MEVICFINKAWWNCEGDDETDNSKQMDHKKWHTCGLASRLVSVLAFCYLIRLD